MLEQRTGHKPPGFKIQGIHLPHRSPICHRSVPHSKTSRQQKSSVNTAVETDRFINKVFRRPLIAEIDIPKLEIVVACGKTQVRSHMIYGDDLISCI